MPDVGEKQLRALVGDDIGLFLVSRRFEGGRLRKTFAFLDDPSTTEISTAELSLLFEGASFTVHTRARAWRGDTGVAQKAHRPVGTGS